MTTIFIHPENLYKFNYSADHPLKPVRTKKTLELCERLGFFNDISKEVYKPDGASLEEMIRFHDPEYMEVIGEVSAGLFTNRLIGCGLGSSDCPIFMGLLEYCATVAGATLDGAKLLIDKKANIVFNPGGGFHHAHKSVAEGFCYVNDIVLGILKFLDSGYRRIMYIDLDAHHGNGVQDAFYEDNRVLTISIHESGKSLFPGGGFEDEIGKNAGKGFNVNIPLLAMTDDRAWMWIFKEIVPPLIKAFNPEVLVTQLGVDTLAADPLTHLHLTNNGICQAVKLIKSFEIPWLIVGGGGYNVDATVRAWTLVWSIINNMEPQDQYAGAIGGMMSGSSELGGSGLYDMQVYTMGSDKTKIDKHNKKIADYIKKVIFPLHGI